MSAAAQVRGVEGRRESERVRRLRGQLRRELRALPLWEGCGLLADVINEMPDWLAGADVESVLSWPCRSGLARARRLYAQTGMLQAHSLRELTPRQRALLVAGLRGREVVSR